MGNLLYEIKTCVTTTDQRRHEHMDDAWRYATVRVKERRPWVYAPLTCECDTRVFLTEMGAVNLAAYSR